MNDKQLHQAMDACPSNHPDLLAAEFGDLHAELGKSPDARAAFERIAAADHQISRSLEDVPVPAELASRLLARLQAAAPASAPVTAAEVQVANIAKAVEPGGQRPRQRVRRAAFAALAASVLAMVGWWFAQPRPISSDDMPQLVAECYDQLDNQWQAMQTAPKSLAVPRGIIGPRDWQDVSEKFGHHAVAYRFVFEGGRQAILFAVNLKLDRVPGMPPARPEPTTGARSIAIWQAGGVAYVLVLKGDGRDYQRLFKSQPGATA